MVVIAGRCSIYKDCSTKKPVFRNRVTILCFVINHAQSAVSSLNVSTAGAVEAIRQAKAQGIAVTAEACPQHFCLTDDLIGIGFDTNLRVNPPIRSQKDVDALATELGLLGTIVQEKLGDGRSAFMLTTAESQDDIIAICSFVLDPDDLRITYAAAPQAAAPASLGDDGI